MATLADSLLADPVELPDNEVDIVGEDNGDIEHMQEDVDEDLADIEKLNYDDLDRVSKLQKSQRYKDIMQKVEKALEKGYENGNHGRFRKDDPEYQLIVECNALSVDIENEIIIVHNFIRDKYRLKFPELESLVQHPIDYAVLVKRIGNEMDLTHVDLEGLLPSATVMVVSVTASTTSGKQLPEEEFNKAMDACDRALALDSDKKKVVDFVESKMGNIAPNLSAIVGSAVAAKLMGSCGGLSALSKMRACSVKLPGARKKGLDGFYSATSQCLEQSDIFQSTPPSLRMDAHRYLASKCILAARFDSIRCDSDGTIGKCFREDILRQIERLQEPPPVSEPKKRRHVVSLQEPPPDSEPKKRRHFVCLRKTSKRINVTEMWKCNNRVSTEESSLGHGLGEGYGKPGQAGSGKLRTSAGPSKLLAKVAKRLSNMQIGSSGATSSLAFTPMQGIELGRGLEVGTFSEVKRTRRS